MRMLVAAVVVLAAQAGATSPEQAIEGKLHGLVFGRADLTASDAARLPEPARARLLTIVARGEAFASRLPPASVGNPDGPDLRTRRSIERAIVVLVAAPGIEGEAERFARAVPLAGTGDHRPAGPLAEATFAEDYLKQDPGGPLAPYLYLFIASRQRAAFEIYARQATAPSGSAAVEGMKATAKKYRAFVQRARAHEDSIVGLVADDIDRQPYLRLKTDAHPRDFNPDT